MGELDTVTSEELLEELRKRSSLFIGIFIPNSESPENTGPLTYVRGAYKDLVWYLECEKHEIIRDASKRRKKG